MKNRRSEKKKNLEENKKIENPHVSFTGIPNHRFISDKNLSVKELFTSNLVGR